VLNSILNSSLVKISNPILNFSCTQVIAAPIISPYQNLKQGYSSSNLVASPSLNNDPLPLVDHDHRNVESFNIVNQPALSKKVKRLRKRSGGPSRSRKKISSSILDKVSSYRYKLLLKICL